MPGVRDLVDELLAAKVKTALFGGDAADRAPRLGRLVVQGRLGHGAMGQVVVTNETIDEWVNAYHQGITDLINR